MPDQAVSRLGELIAESGNTVVFTGAGISTAAGIPDFRSPGGLWSRIKPVSYQEFRSSPDVRARAWRNKFAIDDEIGGARPTIAHRAIAWLVRQGNIATVITQNIDNLHQRSGIADERIVELHGNGSYAKCLDCGERYELADIRRLFSRTQSPPDCDACGGPVKSATIMFGQPMPKREMARAGAASMEAELFIVLGSSLCVRPAAAFPEIARNNGARLVIVNREPTPLDGLAHMTVTADLDDVLAAFLGPEKTGEMLA